MPVSEVARIRANIANEYLAAKWGLTGLAYGTSYHRFITARMEHMERGRVELMNHVGAEQATVLVAETLDLLPETPERNTILDVVEHIKGNAEETGHLIDWIQDMWETIDILRKEFGEEDTNKIIYASKTTLLERLKS